MTSLRNLITITCSCAALISLSIERDASADMLPSTGTIRVIVAPIQFRDSGAAPKEPSFYHNLVFGTHVPSLRTFLEETSYGNLTIIGETLPWLRLPKPGFVPLSSFPVDGHTVFIGDVTRGYCSIRMITNNGVETEGCQSHFEQDAIAAVQRYTTIGPTDLVIFYVDGMDGFGFQTFAALPDPEDDEEFIPVFAVGIPAKSKDLADFTRSEFRHKIVMQTAKNMSKHWLLGLSGSYACHDQAKLRTPILKFPFLNATATKGLFDEYEQLLCKLRIQGDRYSVMGTGSVARHHSSYDKARLGWLKPHQTLIISDRQSSVVDLEATAVPGNGIKEIRIPLENGYGYTIEYKKPVGYDSIVDTVPEPHYEMNLGSAEEPNFYNITPWLDPNKVEIRDAVIIRYRIPPTVLPAVSAVRLRSISLDVNNGDGELTNAERPFFDPFRNISIKVLSKSANTAQVSITFAEMRTVYEAEDPANVLPPGARIVSCKSCSGRKRVGRLEKNQPLEIRNVTLPEAGSRQLKISYMSSRDRKVQIRIGEQIRIMKFPELESGRVGVRSLRIPMPEGSTSIVIENLTAGGMSIDKVEISRQIFR